MEKWLGNVDSNHDYLIQSQASCRLDDSPPILHGPLTGRRRNNTSLSAVAQEGKGFFSKKVSFPPARKARNVSNAEENVSAGAPHRRILLRNPTREVLRTFEKYSILWAGPPYIGSEEVFAPRLKTTDCHVFSMRPVLSAPHAPWRNN